MIRMPHGRHVPRLSTSSSTTVRRIAALLGSAAICATVLPGGVASAATATPGSSNPSLDATLAKANALSQQIDSLSQQYDGLKIQLQQAQAEAALAKLDAARDQRLLAQDQSYISAIAIEGYMSGGMDPAMQLLETSSPQDLLNRASIMTQLEQENGAKVSLVAAANTAAIRAQGAAAQQQRRAKTLAAAMASKVNQIQQRESFFNSQAFQQAAAIYQQTGSYPNIHPDRRLCRRPGAQVGADQGRRPLRLGRGRSECLRLLGPRDVGLRAGGHQPHALHRRPVERRPARLP